MQQRMAHLIEKKIPINDLHDRCSLTLQLSEAETQVYHIQLYGTEIRAIDSRNTYKSVRF